jgi:hypothetical protein
LNTTQPQPGKIIAAAVIGSLALAAMAFMLFWHSTPFDERPHAGFGEAAAREAAKLAGPGGKVALISVDTTLVDRPAIKAQARAFEETLKKSGHTITVRKTVGLDDVRVMRAPPDAFFELLRKQSENDVIVSLVGPPLLTPEQLRKVPEKHARVLAYVSPDLVASMDVKGLLQQGLVNAVIVTRPRPMGTLPSTGGPAEWFRCLFQIVTTDNLAELPVPDAAPRP